MPRKGMAKRCVRCDKLFANAIEGEFCHPCQPTVCECSCPILGRDGLSCVNCKRRVLTQAQIRWLQSRNEVSGVPS